MTPQPLRLLLFNLETDADDPILGFATGWIRALAQHCRSIDVVTMRTGRVDVPENVNVYSVGKERGYGEPRRAVEFYRILAHLGNGRHHDAAFAHMMPLFAVMAWPVLRPRGVPITMWFAHPAAPPLLRVAERVVDRIVTAHEGSFPLRSPKRMVVGQGIDTRRFSPEPRPAEHGPIGPFTVLAVGRVAPIKRLEVVVRALARLEPKGGRPVSLRLVGPADDRAYARALHRAAGAAGVADRVTFAGAVSPADVVREYRSADVLVSLTVAGSFDKTVLEAAATGLPVVTSNPAFGALFREDPHLLLDEAHPGSVAEAIESVRGMSSAERQILGGRMRREVRAHHSLDRLAGRLCGGLILGRS